MNGKVKVAIIVIAVVAISAVVSFVSVVAITGSSDIIFPGVSFKGIDLSNKTRAQAEREIRQYEEALRAQSVNVEFSGGDGSFILADADVKVNRENIIDKAYNVGRQGSYLKQWRERKEVAANGIQIPVEFSVSKEKLKTVLDNITKEIRIPPRDAKFVITPQDTVEIISSANGTGIELEDAFRQLQEYIEESNEPSIELKLVQLKPGQTTEDLMNLRVNGILATFTTWFDIKKENRTENIRVAASALDGYMVKPGEEFSFNKVVGPRSQEAGYKSAKIVLNNKFVDDLGGGVCQVSTTLYNALLQANVKILERSSHSLAITYIPLGQDAAVAYGVKDLRFKNTLPCALVIKTSVSGNSLTFKLFGDASLRKTIQVTNNIIKEYPFKIIYKDDPALPAGTQVVEQKGAKGYRVTSKIAIYQGGVLIEKKSLSSSYYKPLDQIVRVGTKPVPQKPTTGGQSSGGSQPSVPGTGGSGQGTTPPPTIPVTPPPPTDPQPGTDPQTEPVPPPQGQEPNPETGASPSGPEG